MVEGVVQGEDRRLLAPVRRHRGGEGGRHLVGELALLPQPSRLVHELLQLCRHVAEPRRSAEGDCVRPLQVLETRDRLVLDLRAMPAPVLVLGDDQLRGELLHVAEANLSPLASGSLGERVREPVNVAGRAVVDNGDSGRSRHRIASTSDTARQPIRRGLPSRHCLYADTPQRQRATPVGRSKRRRPCGSVPTPGPIRFGAGEPIPGVESGRCTRSDIARDSPDARAQLPRTARPASPR